LYARITVLPTAMHNIRTCKYRIIIEKNKIKLYNLFLLRIHRIIG
jgi:hypothetical protein